MPGCSALSAWTEGMTGTDAGGLGEEPPAGILRGVAVGTIRRAVLVLIGLGVGCAAAPSRVEPAHDEPPRPDAATVRVDAAPAPTVHPFAATAAEAERMIADQIDARSPKLLQCVESARADAGATHPTVTVEIGIDQEGQLLGVASTDAKHPLDSAAKDCMMQVLRTAIFPRSHSGVIAVRQTFKDAAIYR